MLRVPQQHPGHKRRRRGCCAISERPTRSLFAVPSLFRMLSPIIPVDPGNSPVSPIIPVLTQKQGGGALLLNFQLLTLNRFSPLSPTIPAHRRHSPVSPIIPTHTQKQGGRGGYLNGNVSTLCRRADIFGHDVLQGTADANSAYRAPTGGEKNQPEGWPLQGRGGKRQRRKRRHSGEWRSQPIIFWREVVARSFGRRAARTRGRPT
jgi:hypothetical protein